MKLLLAFVFAFSFQIAVAQSPDLLEKQLTNGSSKKWKLTEIDGDAKSSLCRDQLYEFHSRSKMLYRTVCFKRETLKWLITDADYKKYLTISQSNSQMKTAYEIQFVRKNNKILLRLRTADLKNSKQTTDYYFEQV